MKLKPTIYALYILQLPQPFRKQEDLEHATRFTSFESSTPFGQFDVGQSVSDGAAMAYLGRVEHVHHKIGDYGDDKILHAISIYLHGAH